MVSSKGPRRNRKVVVGALAALVLLTGAFAASWLVFDVVRLPRVENALGLHPPYFGFVESREATAPPSFSVASPRPGETVVEGASAFEGMASGATQVAVWVKGVNVALRMDVAASGSWYATVERGMLGPGQTTLVFAPYDAARGAWGTPREVTVDVVVPPEPPLPQGVEPTPPSPFQRYIVQPLFSIFQPIAAKVVAPVSVVIQQADGDINHDGVKDFLQSGPAKPNTLLGGTLYGWLLLIAVTALAVALILLALQPRFVREWLARRRAYRFRKLELLFRQRERRQTRKFVLARREQNAEFFARVEHLRNQASVAETRAKGEPGGIKKWFKDLDKRGERAKRAERAAKLASLQEARERERVIREELREVQAVKKGLQRKAPAGAARPRRAREEDDA